MLPLPHIDDLRDCVAMSEMNNYKMNMTITTTFFLFFSPSGELLQFKRNSLFMYCCLSRRKSKLGDVPQDEGIVHLGHFILISSIFTFVPDFDTTTTKLLTS